MAIIPKTILNDYYWLDKPREDKVEDLIQFEANGGTDIVGEWQFSGSYSITVPVGRIGNSYPYEVRLNPHYSKNRKKSGWRLTLSVSGGVYNRLGELVLSKRVRSKKESRLCIVEAIREYEVSDHYKKVMWPKITHPNNLSPVIKEINGELYWIATTWSGVWNVATNDREYFLGYGQFYTREVKVEYEYPYKKEDGSKDYDRHVEKRSNTYSQVEVSGSVSSAGGGIEDDIKRKIDEAIWNIKGDMLAEYIQRERFEKLTGNSIKYGKS